MSKDYISDVYYQKKMSKRTQDQMHKRINWVLDAAEGTRVLDVGCSQGIVSILLGERGVRVTGLEILEESVNDAEKDLSTCPEAVQKNVDFICSDFLSYDFKEERFDTVIIGQVLEHLEEEEAKQFILKAYSLLGKKGSLIVTVPFGRHDHDDHHITFYIENLMELTYGYFNPASIDIVSKRICLKCTKIGPEDTPEELACEVVTHLYRKAAMQVEDDNIEDIVRLREENNKKNALIKKMREEASAENLHTVTRNQNEFFGIVQQLVEMRDRKLLHIKQNRADCSGKQEKTGEKTLTEQRKLEFSYKNSIVRRDMLNELMQIREGSLAVAKKEIKKQTDLINISLCLSSRKKKDSPAKVLHKILAYMKNYISMPSYVALVTESYGYRYTREDRDLFREIKGLYKDDSVKSIIRLCEEHMSDDELHNAVVLTFCASVVKTRYKDLYVDFALRALENKPSSFLASKMAKELFKSGDLTNTAKFTAYMDRSANLTLQDYHWLQLTKGWLSLREEYLKQDILRKAHCKHDTSKTSVMLCLHNSLPYNSGGYATRSHGIASGLLKEGITPYIYTRMGYPWDRPENRDKGEPDFAADDKVDDLIYRRLFSYGFGVGTAPINRYMYYASRQIMNRAEMHNVSLIHAASNFYTGLPAMLAAKRTGLGFIYEVRGLWEVTRGSREPGWDQSEMFALHADLEAFVAKNADAVITLTGPLKQELINRGVDEEKIYIVPNSVDADKFIPREKNEELAAKYNIADDETVIGFVGSFAQYEGLDDLVKVFAQLVAEGEKVKLLLVGDGAESGTVKKLVKSLKLADSVILTGRVPFEDIPDFYSLIDIAPFPRKPQPVCEMVSPLKPFEAMAMERTVLVSSVEAMAEFIDGKNGCVFEKGSRSDLKDKLKELINDKGRRAELGKYARKWVIENRSWESAVSKLTEVYEEVRTDSEGSSKLSWQAVRKVAVAGNVSLAMENAVKHGVFTEWQKNFYSRLEGIKKVLEQGGDISAPSDRFKNINSNSLVILHNSKPFDHAGYAVRSQTILKALTNSGIKTSALTRPGYPVDLNKHKDKEITSLSVVDGIEYEHHYEDDLYKKVLETDYVAKYAEIIGETADRRGAFILHACSNYVNALAANEAAWQTGRLSVYELRGLWHLTEVSKNKDFEDSEMFRYYELMEKKALHEAHHVIAISESLKDYIVEKMQVPHEKVTVIPNAVDTQIFSPVPKDMALKKSLGLNENTFVVGFLGSITAYEGVELIIEAAGSMKRSGLDIAMVIVGDGMYLEKLKEDVRILGLDNIHFTGRVPFKDVRKYYSIFDVCPFPRLNYEVCRIIPPLKIFEAMAMKVPVIVSDLPALTEIIEPEVTGLAASAGSSLGLTEAIHRLYSDRRQSEEFAEKAYQTVINEKNWAANAEKYVRLYNKLIEGI